MLRKVKMPVSRLLPGLIFLLFSITQPAKAADPYFDQGVKLYNQKNFGTAIPYFDQAIRSSPNNGAAYYYSALSYQQLGDYDRAVKTYKLIQEKFPNSQEGQFAFKALKQLGNASWSKSGNRGQPSSNPTPGAATFQPENWKTSQISAAELKTLPDEAKIPFTRGTGRHLYVDAEVNGRPARMMFDTGAEVCAFGVNQLKAMMLSTGSTQGGQTIQLQGVGEAQTATILPLDIKVGPIKRRVNATVQDHLPTDPLLGQNFFNGFEYEIDNQGGFLHFIKKGGSMAEPMDAIEIPFTRQGNELLVQAKVNGQSCPMYFDTGASGVVFSFSHMIMLGIAVPSDAQTVVGGGIGGSTPGFQFDINSIKLGPIEKTHVPAIFLQAGPPLPLLGQGFLSDRRFIIDNEKRVIKFWR